MKRHHDNTGKRAVTLVLGLSVAIGAVAIGFFSYRAFGPTKDTARLSDQDKEIDVNANLWPDVIQLKQSGILPASPQVLNACMTRIGAVKPIEALADKTNFGDRQPKDVIGRSIPNQPSIIVLHETVIPEKETIALFKTPHPNDNDQASYHSLIARDGRIIQIVPDEKRAYGAGYSAFGDFTVRSKSPNSFSINNVALHVSLVSPDDGNSDASSHQGYTESQYKALAAQILLWQLKYGIPMTRVTTHAAVDRSHSRYDPRSFRWDIFDAYHRQYSVQCGVSNLSAAS